MKFSTKAEYGLKAMVNLAEHYPRVKAVRDISVEEKISLKYTERLVGVLRNGKFLKSYRGKEGGYALAKSPANIKVGEIVEALEGPIKIMNCARHECALQKRCPSSSVWVTLEKQIRKTLYGITLSSLIKR